MRAPAMGRSFYPVPPWESRRRLSRRGQSWRSSSDLGSDAAGVAARTLASVAASGKPFEQVLLIHDAAAQWRDRATVEAIERLDFKRLGPQDACTAPFASRTRAAGGLRGLRCAILAKRVVNTADSPESSAKAPGRCRPTRHHRPCARSLARAVRPRGGITPVGTPGSCFDTRMTREVLTLATFGAAVSS